MRVFVTGWIDHALLTAMVVPLVPSQPNCPDGGRQVGHELFGGEHLWGGLAWGASLNGAAESIGEDVESLNR